MNETDKENLHKEIDLIQECIKRMASNSFLLKGWTISLVAVVLALSEKNVSPLQEHYGAKLLLKPEKLTIQLKPS